MSGSQKKPNKINLDYAASVEPNPGSIHEEGIEAKKKLENARGVVARTLNAHRDEIIFTSGGTEGNNLAIQGVVLACRALDGKKLPHIVTTNIEHPSVLQTFKLMKERGLAQISIVPVEANGIVDPEKIKKEIKENTVLVSVMYANNEIGTIQPIKEIAKEIRHWRKGKSDFSGHRISLLKNSSVPAPSRLQVPDNSLFPFLHTDAVQAANYLDLDVEKLGVDLMTLSGSKIEGAGRVGVLYKRKGTLISNIFGGGDQEFGLRPGTPNLSEIIKFGIALDAVNKIKEKEVKRLATLRDYFFAQLKKSDFTFLTNGDLEKRLPNNINITVPNIPSDLLVIELSAKGIMASAKSACKSGEPGASYVIEAINKNIKDTDGSIRFSMGRSTTKKDIDYTLKTIFQILKKLKKWYT